MAVVLDFDMVAAQCAPGVAITTMRALVATESSFNPYAIGVVDGQLNRQPRSLLEAVSTVKALQSKGIRFSAGLAQIYVGNWSSLKLDVDSVFNPCTNLRAAQVILGDCYSRAVQVTNIEQHALNKAFSCYYSNNFQTGFDAGYVQKVLANAKKGEAKTASSTRTPSGDLFSQR